jgi:ubiquinone/menaquinone biosynthesis C-methylase UbiE
MTNNIPSASHQKTNDKAFELISSLIHKKTKILDLGAGQGHLSRRVFDYLIKNQINHKNLIATDLCKNSFKAKEVVFKKTDFNKKLPFTAKSFDLIYSIEVVEHLRDPYKFLEECFRILKPEGVLIISTPNTLNLASKYKFFITGFFELYKPPSIKLKNAGRLCGHIMPINLAYYDYGLRRVGFKGMELFCDKVNSKSKFLYYLLVPFLVISRRREKKNLKKYDSELYDETKHILSQMYSYTVLTSRSLFFLTRK